MVKQQERVDNIMDYILVLCSAGLYDKVIFPSPSRMDDIAIIAYLSASYSYRDFLPGRGDFYDKSVEILKQRRPKDYKDLIRGLE